MHSSGELKLLRDDPERALTYADECLELAERTSSLKNVIKARRLRGQVLTVLGRPEGAKGELLPALDVPRGWKPAAALANACCSRGGKSGERRSGGGARASFGAAWPVVEDLANSLADPGLREVFLGPA